MKNTPNFYSKIIVKPLDMIKDYHGTVVQDILKKSGFDLNPCVKSGKYFEISFYAKDLDSAKEKIKNISTEVFSNPVIETYEILELKNLEVKGL